MRALFLSVLVIGFIALARSEDCDNNDLTKCVDTFCKHKTQLQCELGVCTCTAPPYKIDCQTKGDCDRHTYSCDVEWTCINHNCRC